ncbi:GNAT family N-acetyltransferase [Microbacterium esteraromaticum]|uniref:GNAT family N-acetyltransferase n=1 Tax=Microbacterium esteraromaticum TaxID=57043 RepID=A0A939DWX1_9MICO|nr:GNAT family protein [Microbacterium esteraromaticum]MBN7794748.1 GNAT family N-acetyltransferase [Microbacterium esteraromaticum]MBN8206830.1 GNAT family N-acetyltransferase [Microbacterium esteraromaticum]MBN8416985.1 GNAT family N-acetyltransferase [Microbacterium esteraromaticum]MBN8425612.1 GNAT family N-acetyltransferase [Microbacterium esteraromaticum]MBY6061722.1 GNAT family N-acetyltransferase [Microbacterium esteraromaticum]
MILPSEPLPALQYDRVALRLVRVRDARTLQRELLANRSWLQPWEATIPGGVATFDMRVSIRRLLQQYRDGGGYPFVMEYDGEIAGQLNIWGVARGSLASATIGYWVSERFAGRGITPTAVALATDAAFEQYGLHRMEICIRPENVASLRVVQKLGFRYEGLRRRYIHIDGDWRDHYAFALTREDVPRGVLARWVAGDAPESAAMIAPGDLPHV